VIDRGAWLQPVNCGVVVTTPMHRKLSIWAEGNTGCWTVADLRTLVAAPMWMGGGARESRWAAGALARELQVESLISAGSTHGWERSRAVADAGPRQRPVVGWSQARSGEHLEIIRRRCPERTAPVGGPAVATLPGGAVSTQLPVRRDSVVKHSGLVPLSRKMPANGWSAALPARGEASANSSATGLGHSLSLRDSAEVHSTLS